MDGKRAVATPESGHAEGEISVSASSGNVFEDLGLPKAQERPAKANLARQIKNIIAERHLTQSQAAGLMGISQPKVSDVVRGTLSGFSMDRLFKVLLALNYDVRILVTPTPQRTKTKPSLRVMPEVAAPGPVEDVARSICP
ncbi:MAG: helix-turn-helix domain-containing protein [Chloroflexota bacterium]|nr:helix-turn-helix domain-containing protein [Chloroflexota bacterium]